MTQTVSAGIEELREVTDGPVIAPGEPDFDQARRVWNAEIDRHPAVIARCYSTRDVVEAIGFAREHGLELAVRGGAHNSAGTGTTEGGVVIDLSAMNSVQVDPDARLVTVGGGALLRDVDAATAQHGLAMPAGLVSHTGIGGLTLGGGMGWLSRKLGLAIDNLEGAQVVTAGGQVLHVCATEYPDLFWAIRGGGGNFGVVTAFEFRLHEVSPTVQFALFFWPQALGPEVLRLAREIIPGLPRDTNAVVASINAPPAPFVPRQHLFEPGYALLLTSFGAAQQHEELVAGIRRRIPPLFDTVAPMPYVELQKLLDGANAWGVHSYEKSAYLQDLSDDVIGVITDHSRRKSSPMSAFMVYRLDGAYSLVGDDETAFSGGRSPRYAAFMLGVAPDSELLAYERHWVRDFWTALSTHAISGGDGYVNGTVDYGDDRVRGSYGQAKYERLARIKAQYDPENTFHLNANIRPA
jgi:hypothetical protein